MIWDVLGCFMVVELLVVDFSSGKVIVCREIDESEVGCVVGFYVSFNGK